MLHGLSASPRTRPPPGVTGLLLTKNSPPLRCPRQPRWHRTRRSCAWLATWPAKPPASASTPHAPHQPRQLRRSCRDQKTHPPAAAYHHQEAAEHLRLCTKTVRRKLAAGELPSHRLGSRILIDEADIAAYLAKSKS